MLSPKYESWKPQVPAAFSSCDPFNLLIPIQPGYSGHERRFLFVFEHVDTQDLRTRHLLGRDSISANWFDSAIELGLEYTKHLKPVKPALAAVNFNFFKTFDLPPNEQAAANDLAANRVHALIEKLDPTDVIIFGDVAAAALLPKVDQRKLLLRRGRPIKRAGRYWTNTISLSRAYQGRRASTDDDEDENEAAFDHANLLGFVGRCVGNALVRRIAYKIEVEAKARLINDIETFRKLLKKLMASDRVAVDTETAGLGRVVNKLLTIQFAFSQQQAYVVPVDHRDAKWSEEEKIEVLDGLRKFFMRKFDPLAKRYDQYLLGQNLKFDLTIIRQRLQIHVIQWRVWDLMAGEYALDENMKALLNCRLPMSGKVSPYSLDWFCAWYGCDFYQTNAFGKDDRNTIEQRSLSEEGLLEYCGMDVQTPWAIHEQQILRANHTLVKNAPYGKRYSKFIVTQMNNLIQIESMMEHRGDHIDVPWLLKLKDRNGPMLTVYKEFDLEFKKSKSVQKANTRLVKDSGLPKTSIWGGADGKAKSTWLFSPSKPAHKQMLFIDILKLEAVSFGKDKVTPKIDKFFQQAHKDVPEVELFTQLTQITSLKNNYVTGFYNRLREDPDMKTDQRIRPSFGFTGTVTGRSNSYDPNLQNIPNHGKFAKYIKRLFTAPRGCLILKMDYSSHEVRMWAIIAGDEILCELFVNGRWLRQQYRKHEDPVYKQLMETKGDIHKVNCVTGDALISTDRGLVRIDQLSDGAPTTTRGVNFRVSTIEGSASAAIWKSLGSRKTVRVTTSEGNSLSTTYDHEYAVWSDANGEIEWKTAKSLKLGDKLCIHPKQTLRHTPLDLQCPVATSNVSNAQLRQVKLPKRMNPDLAKILAYLVSEGTVASYSSGYLVIFSNSDECVVQDYVRLMKKVFGLVVEYGLCKERFDQTISGVTVKSAKPMYGTLVSSKSLVKTLEYLGVYTQVGRIDGKVASHFKTIPWSVMQADSRSQAAFMAAYLEGDGNVENVSGALRWFSCSHELLTQLQVMLNAHGGAPTLGQWRTCEALTLNGVDSARLWPKLAPFMITKQLVLKERIGNAGVPTGFWRNLIAERSVSRGRKMVNDEGVEISVPGWKNYFAKVKSIPYVGSWTGLKDMLVSLKRVSKSGHSKLQTALDQGLRFVTVSKIEDAGTQPVYDLGVNGKAHPSFTANGLVVHNCEFFFKVDAKDVTKDQRNSVKAIVFGAIYGRGAKAIAEAAKAKVEDIKVVLGQFFKRFDKAAKWLEMAKKHAVTNGYMYSPIWRIRNMFTNLYGIDNFNAGTERRGCNAPVQGFAADIGHTAGLLYEIHIEQVVRKFKLDKSRILKAGVNTFVHDAIKTDSPYEYLLVSLQVLQWCATLGVMQYYENHWGIKFPVEIEVDFELAAHDAAHYKWDWSENAGITYEKGEIIGGGLQYIVRRALEDQKEVYPDLDVEKTFKKVYEIRKNTELMEYLDKNYPILDNWHGAKHIDTKSDSFKRGLGKTIRQTRAEAEAALAKKEKVAA